MNKKFIKIIASVISSITIASTGSMIASASSKDRNWFTRPWNNDYAYTYPFEATEDKDNDTSVYISNCGKWVDSYGNYYNKGSKNDVTFSLIGRVKIKRTRYSNWEDIIGYDCETHWSSGKYYNCSKLRLKADTTRVVYQFVSENFVKKGLPRVYCSYYQAKPAVNMSLS